MYCTHGVTVLDHLELSTGNNYNVQAEISSSEPNIQFSQSFAELLSQTVWFGSVQHLSKESSVRPNSDFKVWPNRTFDF